MRKYKQFCWFKILTAVFILSFYWIDFSMGCPACKKPDGVEDGVVSTLENGFSWSTLFLLAFPASILTGLMGIIIKTCKKLDQ